MAIERVEIKDFLVFKGEFAMDFCPGVNVFIGENGTGKTTLLKGMYYKSKAYIPGFKLEIAHINNKAIDITTGGPFGDAMKLSVNGHIANTTYIPEKDILEHAEGLLKFIEQKQTGFSLVYKDILVNAMDVPTNEQSRLQQDIRGIIAKEIGGEVEYDMQGGVFYTVWENGTRIPFANEASGYKKLGLLGLLVKCGQLEPGSVLFWDEPENSLNPALIPVLVDILLELSRNGVQIFLATHSDFLCKWFELKSSDNKDNIIKFISLYKESGSISAEENQYYSSLEHNLIIDQSVALYYEHLRKVTGSDEI
jgi:AAA15 family ATPase/GTPase